MGYVFVFRSMKGMTDKLRLKILLPKVCNRVICLNR